MVNRVENVPWYSARRIGGDGSAAAPIPPIIASSTKRPKLPLPGGRNRFATQVRGASQAIALACEAAAHSVHPGQLLFCRLVRLDLDRLAQSDRVLWVYCSTT